MRTVFCLDVWPAATSAFEPVTPAKYWQTSLLALPSRGGADTRRIILRLHSSYPSGPGRLDLGDTEMSISTNPSPVLQTSDTFIRWEMRRTAINLTLMEGVIYRTGHEPMMSAAVGPMTFDELSELYRVEMKSASLTQPRRDLFRAMANLLLTLRKEYDRQMSLDPDSVMTEGAEQRRKKAERLCKDIMVLRTRKIASMAIRGAEGARNVLDCLTDEEHEYYDKVLELTKTQLSEVDRLRGKRTVVPTRIDEPPKVEIVEPEPVPEEPAPKAPVTETVPDEEPPLEEMFEDAFEEPFDSQDDIMEAEPPAEIPEPVPEEPAHETPVPEPTPAETGGTQETPDGNGSDLSPVPIRILEDLPEFAGPDRDYKLSKEDVVTLPKVLADVLINTGKAALIRPTP